MSALHDEMLRLGREAGLSTHEDCPTFWWVRFACEDPEGDPLTHRYAEGCPGCMIALHALAMSAPAVAGCDENGILTSAVQATNEAIRRAGYPLPLVPEP